MRVHLSQISASKKAAAAAAAAQEKAMELCDGDDNNGEDDGSYPPLQGTSMNAEMEDGDQSNSYELRENPKKSWRISDPKHGLINNSNSCKECGKEFVSLRALSGHMRCHSIKNKKEVHHCKECGRGFDSIRAMFGHMKSHSKRVKVESADSLSDLENFCPIRRKRSRIRYKGTVNPSFSGVDASDSAVSELEEAEEAAKCLVMLSRGVRSCLRLDSSNVESDDDDDDSAYFGGVTSCRSKRFCGNGGDYVKECDEHGLKLVDEFDLVFGNGMKKVVDLVCDDEFLKSGFENNSSENEDDLEMMEDLEKKPKHKQRVQKTSSNLCRNGSLLSVNEADTCNGEDDQLEREIGSVVSLSLDSSKSKKRECPICFKVFSSGQALGGHKRAHYNGVVESKNREAAEEDRGILDLNFPISGYVGLDSWFVERKHEALMLTT